MNVIQTATGRIVDPFALLPVDIDPADIAASLSKLCRYNGHTSRFYSVAEHSVLVSTVVPVEHALWGLLHDAAEAYLGDMPRPIKRRFPAFAAAEEAILRNVARVFSLPERIPASVHDADLRITNDERAALLRPGNDAHWSGLGEPLGVTVRGLSPADAEKLFIRRFFELVGDWP